MKYYIVLFLCALFFPVLFPASVSAAVRINEVAWMGTAASQYSEWIELYNDAADAVSLKDWKLYKTDAVLLYTLSKSIPGKGYLLIERTTPTASDAVPGINDEAGAFGGSGLRNTGEDLVLEDKEGTVIDKLSFASGWPAGDAKTKDTMQVSGSTWITAPGTPDAVNATKNTITTAANTQSPQTSSVVVPPVGSSAVSGSTSQGTNSSNSSSAQIPPTAGTPDSNQSSSTGTTSKIENNSGQSDAQNSSPVAVPATLRNVSSGITINSQVPPTAEPAGTVSHSSKTIPTSQSASQKKSSTKAPAVISNADTAANDASASSLEDSSNQAASAEGYGAPKENNHTKIIIFGAVILIGIALFLLLERFKAHQE
jgi:hypothetical protein